MTTFVMIVLAIAVVLLTGFIFGKFSYPAVAISVIVALQVTGVLSTKETWTGFSSTTTILFACMFVLSAGLAKISLLPKLATLIVPEGSSKRRAVIGCGLLTILLADHPADRVQRHLLHHGHHDARVLQRGQQSRHLPQAAAEALCGPVQPVGRRHSCGSGRDRLQRQQ